MHPDRLRTATRGCRAGFTLVELMVTLAVAAVLVTIAVPSFKRITVSSRLTTTANSMVDALNLARMEAIKRNDDTQFCGATGNGGQTLGTACGETRSGAVYALTGTPAAASTVQLRAPTEITAASLHLKTVLPIQFSAQGLGHKVGGSGPFTGTVAVVCSSAIDTDNVRTVEMTTGSILKVDTSQGTCP